MWVIINAQLCNAISSNDLWSDHAQFNSISSIYYLQTITIRMVRDVRPAILCYTIWDNQTSTILCDSTTESCSQSCIIRSFCWVKLLRIKEAQNISDERNCRNLLHYVHKNLVYLVFIKFLKIFQQRNRHKN